MSQNTNTCLMLEVGKRRRMWIVNGLQLNAYLPRWSVSLAEFFVKHKLERSGRIVAHCHVL